MRFFLYNFILCSFTLSAQSHFSLGFSYGMGPTWMSNTHNTVEFKPTINSGGSFLMSGRYWAIGADLKYSLEGVKYTYLTTDMENKYTLQYIRMPLKAYYFFSEYGKTIRPKIGLGPSFGYLLHAQHQVGDSEGQVSYAGSESSQFTQFDVGIQGTMGVNVTVTDGIWLNADMNFYNGLTTVHTLGMKNRNLSFNLGIQFGIGKEKSRF